MKTLNFNGVEYPLLLSVSACEIIEEHYGDWGKVSDAISAKSKAKTARELCFLLAALARGGRDALAAYGAPTGAEPPSEDQLLHGMTPGRLVGCRPLVLEVLSEGLAVSVEAESEKNRETTRGQ